MARDTGRVDVGHGEFPFMAVGIAVVVMIAVVIGAAYASRTPFGAEIGATGDVDSAVNEHLAKNYSRFPQRRTYFNCAEFLDSIFSGNQNLAVAVELGNWRPGAEQTAMVGNLVVASAKQEGDGPWQVASKPIPNASYDPSPKLIEKDDHPCNQAKF